MRSRQWLAVVLAGGLLGGCGTPTWALLYKPLADARVTVPFPSVCAKGDGIAIYVAPEAKRVIEGELGVNAGRQEFVVELLVSNERDEAVVFQSRNVSVAAEGNTGRAAEAVEVVLNPGQHTGRYELHIPVEGRGKADARQDKVELVVEVKGVSSGKTIAVRVLLLFTVSQV